MLSNPYSSPATELRAGDLDTSSTLPLPSLSCGRDVENSQRGMLSVVVEACSGNPEEGLGQASQEVCLQWVLKDKQEFAKL